MGTEYLTHSVVRNCSPLIENDGSEIRTIKKFWIARLDSRYEMSLLLATGQSTGAGSQLLGERSDFKGRYDNENTGHTQGVSFN